MVGSLGTRGRDGLTARQAGLVVAKAPSPEEAIQLAGQLKLCVIRPCGRRLAQNR